MKKLLLFAAVFFCGLAHAAQGLNAIIGDTGWQSVLGAHANAGETEKISAHLLYVEQLLRAHAPEGLNESQLANRLRLLDALAVYREAKSFPVNEDFPGERKPHFIDSRGVICAVGYLVEVSAGRAEAERINAKYSYAYISEMKDEGLSQWMDENGFTALECAMIQPTYKSVSPGPVIAPIDSLPVYVNRRIQYSGKPDSCVVSFYANRLGPLTECSVESGNRMLGDAALNAMRNLGNMNYWAYPKTSSDPNPVFVRMKIYYGIKPVPPASPGVITYESIRTEKTVLPAADGKSQRIIGQVTDESSKAVIGGSSVTAYAADGKIVASALTDYNGNYELLIPEGMTGSLKLVFSTENYRAVTVKNVPAGSCEVSVTVKKSVNEKTEKCATLSCIGELYLGLPATNTK